MSRPRSSEKVDRNSYGTPASVVSVARSLMRSIHIDPASNVRAQAVVQAAFWCGFDQPDSRYRDGLRVTWPGTVWLNPPYGRGLVKPFIERLFAQLAEGPTEQACVLVNSDPSTDANQRLLTSANAVWFPDYRISFLHPETGAPVRGNEYPQMFCYFDRREHELSVRSAASRLRDALEQHGLTGAVR